MSRSFSPTQLVALPRMTAVSTARLLAELLETASREPGLPIAIAADRNTLAVTHETLQVELGKRVFAEGEASPVVAVADRVEDNAFGALSDWLLSFKRLPVERYPAAADAARVHDALFGQGLGFLRLRAADEWQEAETRIRILMEKGFDVVIANLGGKPFLDELIFAHTAYGEALGITKARPASDPHSLGKAQGEALDALRSYVLRVAAHVRENDPATAALAERLLAPLAVWKGRRPKNRRGAAAKEAARVKAPEEAVIRVE
ncbi:hypothetical protein [Polyangium sorediatum]|uniref:Uncharacterized protein n=1 Tax=Polyangium sorediatum TaxID=889274 RepID=A0ABT6PAM3_9BACT|nr:hypothetical protein [Polyangium sorediatum]MDI1437683.1 hypothetical protein [Polyangium sorediatum]